MFCLEEVELKINSFPVARIYSSFIDIQFRIKLFTRKHVVLLTNSLFNSY